MKTNSMSQSYRLLVPVAIAIGLLAAGPARAGTLDFAVQSISASVPSTGNFIEVDLTNNTGAAVDIDAFSFGLTEATNTIIFTSATTATVNNAYIFAGAGNSLDELLNAGVVSGSAGAGFLAAGDLWLGLAPNGFSLGDGVTVGLGEVFFNVPAGAAGQYVVAFDPTQTSLSDITGAPIATGNETSGTTTTPAAAVPEPSSLMLFGLAAALLVWARKSLVAPPAPCTVDIRKTIL